jgi:PKD repeat protein
MINLQLCFAQVQEWTLVETKSKSYTHQKSIIEENKSYSISNQHEFTSVAVQVLSNQNFDGAYLETTNGARYYLFEDEHATPNDGVKNSNLISFDNSISDLKFYSNTIIGNVSFHFINGGKENSGETNRKSTISDCFSEPESIAQSSWRQGLTAPSFNRSFTDVSHLIIHHSAGSNTNTNYSQVVRDIYLYHTEVNGWSDIGYNYLIAQDGTIFKGRDPDSGEQDNVRGAHFCGKNTGTMGVCLLGNYTSTSATDESIQSLMNLLSWKLDKNELNAYEAFNHNNNDLGSIVGHRDGCATECPGSLVYNQIEQFKHNINSKIEACYPDKLVASFLPETIEVSIDELISFTDASEGEVLQWNWKFVGANQSVSSEQNPVDIFYSNTGEYDVQLVIRNGSRTDTSEVNKIVKVLAPIVIAENKTYPNPVNINEPLTFEFNGERISQIEISDLSGNVIHKSTTEGNEMVYDLNQIRAGIYFVRFYELGKVSQSQKFIVLN